MDQNNPQQPYIPKQGNPYDFIMQDQKRQKRFSLGGGSKKHLLFMIGGGILALLVLVFVYNLFFGGNDKAKDLITVIAEQQEISRIADIGVQDATGTEAKNLAVTTKASVASQQKELLTLLTKSKQKITKEQLAAEKNTATDDVLTEAKENNRFDSVFIEVIKESLQAYSASLERNYNSLSSAEPKRIIKNSYDSTQNLLK